MQLTCMVINVQGNNYYMVEGSPHVWLTCMVINMQANYYYMMEGSPHVQLTCTVINVQGNNYYMIEGSPHVWLMLHSTYVVDGWFLGDFFWKVEGSSVHTCESCAAINVHGNYYYMVEGSPHVWFTLHNN